MGDDLRQKQRSYLSIPFILEKPMKTAVVTLSISLIFLLSASGCSREESPEASGKIPKVVKRITKPTPKATESPKPPARTEPETKDEEAPAKKAEDVKRVESSKPDVTAKEEPDRKAEAVSQEVGVYIVKGGETLSSISGREEVYKDPLKWPLLLRQNADGLKALAMDKDLPQKSLPKGLKLKYLSTDEAQKRAAGLGKRAWVINVLSTPLEERITPATIALIQEGYQAYITRIRVKETDWMRLRVGFFETKAVVEKEGEKIKTVLGLKDAWNVRISESEFREFGGY
jgi:hypothetical protein